MDNSDGKIFKKSGKKNKKTDMIIFRNTIRNRHKREKERERDR